jgi:putative oxidoreductase
MASLGVPQPHIMAWATSLIEFIGGISLMAGAFVVAISVPLAVIMITAMVTVHLRYGYSSVRLQAVTDAGAQFGPVGYELNLLYLAALVTLVALGPGSFSVDGWLSNRRSGRRAALPRPE